MTATVSQRTPDPDPEAELGHEYDGPELHTGTPEYEAELAEYQGWAGRAEPESEARPDAAADSRPEPEIAEAYGPHLPTMRDVWDARRAADLAHEAGCSGAERERLILDLLRTEEAVPGFFAEPEIEP
jgi:hypothetical protein